MYSLLRIFVFSSLLCLIVNVQAHTYFSALIVGGTHLSEGDCIRPHPGSRYDYPISSLDNKNGILTNNMTCGFLPNAGKAANRKCPIAAGSTVGIQWHYEMGLGSSDTFFIDPSHHGPCFVYLAKSDTGAGAVWFKIFEDGYNTSSKTWCVDRLKTNKGVFTFTIPSDLSPGNYLLRGELLALHEGDQLGGAQPYVHCAEITISGSGVAIPDSTYLASFPGAYSANDAGVHFDIYDGFKTYPIPGPKLYIAGAQSSGSSNVVTTGGNRIVTTGLVKPSTTGSNKLITSGANQSPSSTSGSVKPFTTGSNKSITSGANQSPSSTSGSIKPSTTGKKVSTPSTTGNPSFFNFYEFFIQYLHWKSTKMHR